VFYLKTGGRSENLVRRREKILYVMFVFDLEADFLVYIKKKNNRKTGKLIENALFFFEKLVFVTLDIINLLHCKITVRKDGKILWENLQLIVLVFR